MYELKDIKVGYIVSFYECWEDEAGAYHDENAEVLEIDKDGNLKLKWLNVSKEVEEELNSFGFTVQILFFI